MSDDSLRALFKYRSLSGVHGRASIEKAVLGSQLRWQNPASFNDPFDCKPFFIFGADADQRRKYAREVARRRMPGSGRAERLAEARRMSQMTQERASELCDAVIDRSVVTCFSRVNDQPLMWAHYAENHTGVCLMFEEAIKPHPFISLKVEYSATRPSVDLIELGQGGGALMKKIMLTKAESWSYEQEQRMMQRGDPGFFAFPAACLTGIILGARISADDREFIRELVGRRPGPLSVFQAELDQREYRFHIRPVP